VKTDSSDRTAGWDGPAGVDSSVAALLLQQQGVSAQGAYMKNWINEEGVLGDCPCATEDHPRCSGRSRVFGDTVSRCQLDGRLSFESVAYLLQGYESGVTPNPDVMCNRELIRRFFGIRASPRF